MSMAPTVPWRVALRSALLAPVKRLMIWGRKGMRTLQLSDTTLRDGEQMPGVRLRPEQKVVLAQALAEAGIDSLDAGFPAAAPEEAEAIRRIVREVRGPVITALARCARPDIDQAG